MQTTFVDTSGRGDDFTATAHCTATDCEWFQHFSLDDSGDFERTVLKAEAAADSHRRAHLDEEAFRTDEDRFGPQD